MAKRIILAILWGFCGWMWTAIAHVFLGTPEVSAFAGALALVVAYALLAPRSTETPRQAVPPRMDVHTGFDTAQSHR